MNVRAFFQQWHMFLAILLVAVCFLFLAIMLFVRARFVMEEQIRASLSSTAAAAAFHIDGDALDAIHGPRDINKQEYTDIVKLLQQLRDLPGIRFAYIFRRTDDPQMLAFVADADVATDERDLDFNGNGRLDADEEPGYPGELYDISENDSLKNEAFLHATADKEITYDQWGALVSGYAPIHRKDGTVNAVLGIDMRADDFELLSQNVFSPTALALLLAGVIFIAAYISFQWENRKREVIEKIDGERSALLRLTFHQLGEPLTIMKWSLETLRDETEDEELKKIVADHVICMDEGLGRLNSIIDTLQLAEKVDLNTLEYLPVSFSLRAIVDNLVNEWSGAAQKHDLKIIVEMDDDITVPMDTTLIPLVLRQFIVNAIEYAEPRTSIHIRVHKRHGEVVISVEDTGCGISKKDLQHLFDKYHRGAEAQRVKPDGNGLGLYIAKGIIDKAGGRIWVKSELHKGTTVSFTLPLPL